MKLCTIYLLDWQIFNNGGLPRSNDTSHTIKQYESNVRFDGHWSGWYVKQSVKRHERHRLIQSSISLTLVTRHSVSVSVSVPVSARLQSDTEWWMKSVTNKDRCSSPPIISYRRVRTMARSWLTIKVTNIYSYKSLKDNSQIKWVVHIRIHICFQWTIDWFLSISSLIVDYCLPM